MSNDSLARSATRRIDLSEIANHAEVIGNVTAALIDLDATYFDNQVTFTFLSTKDARSYIQRARQIVEERLAIIREAVESARSQSAPMNTANVDEIIEECAKLMEKYLIAADQTPYYAKAVTDQVIRHPLKGRFTASSTRDFNDWWNEQAKTTMTEEEKRMLFSWCSLAWKDAQSAPSATVYGTNAMEHEVVAAALLAMDKSRSEADVRKDYIRLREATAKLRDELRRADSRASSHGERKDE